MVRLRALLLLLLMHTHAFAEEEITMELLIFLAEYTNEQGDWDAPELDASGKHDSDDRDEPRE